MQNNAKLRTGVLIILDGFGINAAKENNAVKQASTPNLDRLYQQYPFTKLEASEEFVGLPKTFMGNSEVGHLNIGAGRVVYQDLSLISNEIETGKFFKNPVLLNLFEKIKLNKGNLHLMGLVSDGGVHSHQSHLHSLLRWAKKESIKKIFVHVITDGRDTSPTSGIEYVKALKLVCDEVKNATIASISGRFFAMDRDKRWERVEKAYRAIVENRSPVKFSDPISYIKGEYELTRTDEFIEPAADENYEGIQKGDGFLFFNYRADRAREITQAIIDPSFSFFKRSRVSELSTFVCMTRYDENFKLPFAYSKARVPNTIGEIVSRHNLQQLRIAETEKYAHVTYFFNGGDEGVFQGEKRILIPSPKEVKTYDLKPEMSAREVTKTLLAELQKNSYSFVVVNFANPDMVGHTGNLKAAIQAVETIDQCLGQVVNWVENNDAFAVLTADHGNCEKMVDDFGNVLTSHTLLPVPFILIDTKHKGDRLKLGSLCDIAPTILRVWGIKQPIEMTGVNLLSSS